MLGEDGLRKGLSRRGKSHPLRVGLSGAPDPACAPVKLKTQETVTSILTSCDITSCSVCTHDPFES